MNRQRTANAYTILELLIVFFLVGILLTVGTGGMGKFAKIRSVTKGSDRVKEALIRAKNKSYTIASTETLPEKYTDFQFECNTGTKDKITISGVLASPPPENEVIELSAMPNNTQLDSCYYYDLNGTKSGNLTHSAVRFPLKGNELVSFYDYTNSTLINADRFIIQVTDSYSSVEKRCVEVKYPTGAIHSIKCPA